MPLLDMEYDLVLNEHFANCPAMKTRAANAELITEDYG